ncbi:MAG: glycine cleavage system protein GcvH [Bacillota bacterium]
MIQEGLLYSKDHEWLRVDGGRGRLGITDYAQETLGSVVFIELPEEGAEVEAGETIGVLESVKAASDYYAPVAGKVLAVNRTLENTPGLVNEDPFGDGWILEMEIRDPSELDKLLSAGDYARLTNNADTE